MCFSSFWLLMFMVAQVLAFAPFASRHSQDTLCLFALGKAQNKQAELARKLELAKKQQRHGDDNAAKITRDSDDDTKRRAEQERSEFALLLAKNAPPPETKRKALIREEFFPQAEKPTAPTGSKPKAAVKRRKKAAGAPGVAEPDEDQHFQEGDIARRRHFESLVSVTTKQPLGPMAAAHLVPWVPPYLSRYLIILADPRKQSPELRSALQFLTSSTAPSILLNTVAIVADTPEETTA